MRVMSVIIMSDNVNIKFIDEDEGLIAELQASPKDELVIKRLTPKPN